MMPLNNRRVMFRERSAVLVGSRRRGVWRARLCELRVGQRSSVQTGWKWALAREESHGDVLGFWHTHPPRATTQPSPRDVRTMQAWQLALGKPLLCAIECRTQLRCVLFSEGASQYRNVLFSRVSGRCVVAVDKSKRRNT